MISDQETTIIINTARAFRPAWDVYAIKIIILELANAGYSAADIADAAWRAAQDQQWKRPSGIAYLAQNMSKDQHPQATRPETQIVCETCGRSEKACQKAQQNQIKIGNDVHDRHRGREWTDDPRHDFEPHILGEDGEIRDHGPKIEEIRVMLAANRTTMIDREPYVPVDLVREGYYPVTVEEAIDQALTRASGDDQETQQGAG